MGIKGFNTLLVNALQDETSAGYQQYTVEHSLLAFIFDVVRNKDDAQLLLREWSGLRANIFTREYIGEQQYLQFSSRQGLTNLAQEVFTNLIRLLHGFPYQAPVSDGKATQWIVYPDGSTVALGNFSDCIETSIRHLFNYSLGCSGMHSFDKEAIRARVKAMFPNEGQLRGDDHLDEIETFYQTIHDPNDIGHATRSLWNLVTFGLNSADEMQSPHCVRYELTRDLPNSGNELLSNICNVLKAVGGILGIRASTIMEGVDNLDDVLVKLNDLLSLINDSNTYDLHVVQSNIGDDISVDSIYAEIAIDIGVLSKNRTFDDGYYVFTLNSIPGHGFVSLPNRQIASLTNTTVNDIERNVFSYFFDEYPGQSPYSHIFALPSLGNFETILTKAVQVYENTSDTNLRTSFHSVFEKVAARMSLTDFGVASYLYESIIMASLFNNTTYQSVRHAIHDPVTLPPDLRHVILEIDAADVPLFDMSHNNGFTISLDLNGEITQVLREGRIPNYLKALKFTTHAAIDELDLSNFSELTSLEVYCESLNGFKPPKNGQLKSYIFNNTVYQI
jgi:hypothetical protein